MGFLMGFIVTPVEYVGYFVLGTALLCILGVTMLFVMGATWATADWLVCLTYCMITRKKAPTWWSRFMALESTSLGGL